MSQLDRAELLGAWLTLEHEAVWLYGVIGGRVDDVSDAAHRAWDRHRRTRDTLLGVIRSAGGNPTGPAMGYEPTQIDSESAARSAAQSVEERISTACVNVLASAPDRHRAAKGLLGSAEEATIWGAKPQAFPGLS